MKALSLSDTGSTPKTQGPFLARIDSSEPSVDARLRKLEALVLMPAQKEGFVDRVEYDLAIRAIANGDRCKKLDAYIKKGGRIPRDEN